jgi:hypothetical protein
MSETTTDQGFDFEPAYRERGGSAIYGRHDPRKLERTVNVTGAHKAPAALNARTYP